MKTWANLTLFCLTLTVDPAQVKRIIDGDTFALYHVGVPAEERIRVTPIDTPERGKAGYVEATLFTLNWLKAGPFDVITCKRDSFGRLLADVSRDGVLLADELVKAGHATIWKAK